MLFFEQNDNITDYSDGMYIPIISSPKFKYYAGLTNFHMSYVPEMIIN